jgi:uncharacterized membrane protein
MGRTDFTLCPAEGYRPEEFSMINLVLASVFFPLSHFLISSTPLRATLVNLLGEARYALSYSLLAVAAVFWLIFAHRHAPVLPLWDSPWWLDRALFPVMVVSSILAAAGLTTPNPVIVRSEALFERPDIVRRVLRVTRNAFFWGVGIFSIAQVIVLGNVAGMLTFGSIGVLAIAGAFVLDAKKARTQGKAWDAFAAATSNIPLLAIVQGRQRLILREIGLWRIALGVCVSLGALILHRV